MDQTKIRNAIQKALSETFEGMSFSEVLDIVQIDKLPTLISKDWNVVDISGELENEQYEIVLMISNNHLDNIVQIGLGESEDKKTTDVMLEYMNTIGGCFLRHLSENQQSFRLSLPHVGNINDVKPDAMILFVDIDGHDIYVCIQQ